jgi:hypothetical protein
MEHRSLSKKQFVRKRRAFLGYPTEWASWLTVVDPMDTLNSYVPQMGDRIVYVKEANFIAKNILRQLLFLVRVMNIT